MKYDKIVMNIPARKKLDCLYSLSAVLSRPGNLEEALNETLGLLNRHLGISRGAISLLNSRTGRINLVAAYGLSPEEMARGSYDLGEEVTGRVVETGRPMAVPKVAEEPLFLDRTGTRQGSSEDIAFLCVPIKAPDAGPESSASPDNSVGALWVDRAGPGGGELDQEVDFLLLISGMIAQSVARLEALRLEEENSRLKSQLTTRFSSSNLIGHSEAMYEVFALIEKVVRSRTTVLLRGESGTGKSLVAAAIHYSSQRAEESFIKVNCAALPETLLEAELFGHEKGAFTGAATKRKGRFLTAQEGTIFLDEVGSMPLATQAKLLRVLQEKEVEPLGSDTPQPVDVRVLAATNTDLAAQVEEGEFREDLYYRLNVVSLTLPPLNQRAGDIPLLAGHFLGQANEKNSRSVKGISEEALRLLSAYDWPGNVRQLANVIERGVVLCPGETLGPEQLPAEIRSGDHSSGGWFKPGVTLKQSEEALIRWTLEQTRGNRTHAAERLEVSRKTLQNKIKEYGLERVGLEE